MVLNDLSLNVPSGSVVALVGPSRSGKSSIVSLVQNMYEVCQGMVTIDGMNVIDLFPDWISNHVSVVSQEPTMEDIREAARLANAS